MSDTENNWERIEAVQRMQDYILAHYQEDISLKDIATAAGYSPWHALRAFSELIGKTPFEYLRWVRLTEAAKLLRETNMSVLDIALESAFGSHEGFTKAFSQFFAVSPKRYREQMPPIRQFTYYPIAKYFHFLERSSQRMDTFVIFTQVIDRPNRKFIIKRGFKAKDYFAYCEEVGCDIWGILESIQATMNESIGVWLPEEFRKPGTSEYCQGVEVPIDFSGEIPEGFELIDLPACKYLVFQSEPFEDEKFEDAISATWEAIKRYDPKLFGWEWAPEAGPRFQLSPIGERGYIEGLPVREIPK